MTEITNIPGLVPLPQARVQAGQIPEAAVDNVAVAAAPVMNDDQNTATAATDWTADGDVNLEHIKLETLGAAMRKAVLNDGSTDPKEAAFIERLTHFLWPDKAHTTNPGGGAGPTTPTSPWTVGTDAMTDADGKGFSSVGDPHETTGDGVKFDNMASGTFIKAKSASGDFELQTTQDKDKSGRWPGATLNQKAAVKSGKDVVAYDGLAKTLQINGQAVDVASLPKTLADGGKVEKTADGIKITTGKNDVVEIHQRDAYIDVTGKIGNRKDGEVRGSLGAFDKGTDGGNDLLGRTGNTPVKDKNAFIEEWRVKPNEDLSAANPGGGAGPKDAIDQEFDKLDKTGEGYLSGAEIPADLKAFYPGKDRIDRADFRAFKNGAADEAKAKAQDEEDFKKLDVTGDGWLSGTEAKGSEKYDKGNNFKGKDGQEIKEISKEEFMAGRAAERAAKRAADPNGGGVKPPVDPKPTDDKKVDSTPERQAIANDLKEFDRLDKNHDGKLTGKNTAEKYKAYDANGDGKITRQEFLAGRAAERADKRFDAMDKDKDGKLKADELKDKFKAYDTNGDGVVDKEEFRAGRLEDTNKQRDELEFNRLDRTQDGFLTGKRTVKKYKAYDENGDGKISKEEFLKGRQTERVDASFKAKDKTGEGYLSGGELNAKDKAADANQDGRVTQAEYRGFYATTQHDKDDKEAAEREFRAKDRNKDGKLTGQQTYAGVKQYDANKDGEVSHDEFVAARAKELAADRVDDAQK